MTARLLPIFLRLEHLPVLIVGGGRVGSRRARSLLEAGARQITAVSPAFDPEMPEGVVRRQETFRPEHLDRQRLVFAAVNSTEVNEAVANAASSRGILCCRADDAPEGDFIVPAAGSFGPITWAVSAGVPAMSARLQEAISDAAAPWRELAGFTYRLRQRAKGIADAESRRALLEAASSDEARKILASGDARTLAEWLERRHPRFSAQIRAAAE